VYVRYIKGLLSFAKVNDWDPYKNDWDPHKNENGEKENGEKI